MRGMGSDRQWVKPGIVRLLKNCEGYDYVIGNFQRMFQSTL